MSDIKGIISVIKPTGVSSFFMVKCINSVLDCSKAGHTGTLDPLAAGLLTVCLGRATKIIPYLPEERKEYIAEITLGTATDTLDAEGQVISSSNSWIDLNREDIINCLEYFKGKIAQIPPMFSAVSQQGKRLYKIARQGKTVEREPRQVEIFELELLRLNLPVIQLRINCSPGTYIRALARDIGEKLNTGAFLSFLVRNKSGPFSLQESFTFAEIKKRFLAGKKDFIIPMDYPLDHKAVFLKEKAYKKAVNGASLQISDIQTPEKEIEKDEKVLVYDHQKNFISINQLQLSEKEGRILKPLRVFFNE